MFLLLQPGRICMKLSKNGQKRDGRIKLENGGTRRKRQKAEKLNKVSILRNATDLLGCSVLLVNSIFARTRLAETHTIPP